MRLLRTNLATSVALALLASAMLGSCTRTTAPGDRIGRIDAIAGGAVLIHGDQRVAVTASYPVFGGDRIETGPTGKVQITLRDHSIVAVGPGTKLTIDELLLDGRTRSGKLSVAVGRFWMHVTHWRRGESLYEIETPSAVAGVRGTTLWGDTDVDAICSLDGNVEVRSRTATGLSPAMLTAGNCAGSLSQGKLEPLAPPKEEIERYLSEVLIPSAPR